MTAIGHNMDWKKYFRADGRINNRMALDDTEIIQATSFLGDVDYIERLYALKLGITEKPLCPICGEKRKFFRSNYLETCGSKSCVNHLRYQRDPDKISQLYSKSLGLIQQKIELDQYDEYSYDEVIEYYESNKNTNWLLRTRQF